MTARENAAVKDLAWLLRRRMTTRGCDVKDLVGLICTHTGGYGILPYGEEMLYIGRGGACSSRPAISNPPHACQLTYVLYPDVLILYSKYGIIPTKEVTV